MITVQLKKSIKYGKIAPVRFYNLILFGLLLQKAKPKAEKFLVLPFFYVKLIGGEVYSLWVY
jgi:hypothetical protein